MIAIHYSKTGFSDRWIAYCETNHIDYKIVDCYRSDIIDQLDDCDGLMWHINHQSPKDVLFGRQLLYSVQAAGKKVFPDYNTMWHFDDKVGQKYLLEAIKAPLVPTWVFYTKKEAIAWAGVTCFPKVFKLRGGAGSANVKLAETKSQALQFIRQSFGHGFRHYDAVGNLKERIRKYKLGKTDVFDVVKGFIRLIYPTQYSVIAGVERGYIYFQEFISCNHFDIRVIVIGNRAFSIKRMTRANDFRASGSGEIKYDKCNFSDKVIRLSFSIAQTLHSQCIAFDYVYKDSEPLLLEISYGFVKEVYDKCVGYWDINMNWHEGTFNPYGWMVEVVLRSK